MAETVISRNIKEEMKTSYLTYAMSVIISRALPDVRDGLKPVHRRVLYAMHRLGLTYNRPFKKAAYVVGEVLAKYHPHGDQAVYDTLVRLAQDFSMRLPLIDGQGNFGSIDGDGAAAMRYTEARMARVCEEMLRDIQKETVDFENNYDDSLKEPTVLPSVLPNLLINGGTGIAVGMATSFPPHNINDATRAVIHYIDNRECSTESLIEKIKGPDFPTAGIIYNVQGIKQGYLTGKGIFKIRGRVAIEAYRKDREAIVITEIPYLVNKSEMIKKMASLVKTDVIAGISEIRDESGKEGIRIVIELKKDVNTQIILNQLFKHTTLESSFSINCVAIVGKVPKTLNLKEIIVHFTNHRHEVITRRTRFDLKKAEERAHIVEGLIKAVDNIDAVIKIIRASETVDLAKKELRASFAFSEVQAQAILDMRLARLVALEIKKLQEELVELKRLIGEYQDLLANPEKIYTLIKNDLQAIRETYGEDRKSEIAKTDIEALEDEAYIQRTNVVISLSTSGYIKRNSPGLYRQQHRGGVGVKSTTGREEDVVSMLFVTTTHDTIMFFTNWGKAYYLKAHEIPEASRIARGLHIKMLLNLGAGEEVQGYLTFADFETANRFILVTAKGIAKKGEVGDLINAKKRGMQAIKLRSGDTLVGTVEVNLGDDIIICSRRGFAIRIHEDQFRVMGRVASGVRGMNIASSDEVVGVEKVVPGQHLLVVTERGLGKKVDLGQFSPYLRGGKGQIYLKTGERSGEIAGIKNIEASDSILIITSSGAIIRLDAKEVNLMGRPAQGTKLLEVKPPDIVVDTAIIRPLKEG